MSCQNPAIQLARTEWCLCSTQWWFPCWIPSSTVWGTEMWRRRWERQLSEYILRVHSYYFRWPEFLLTSITCRPFQMLFNWLLKFKSHFSHFSTPVNQLRDTLKSVIIKVVTITIINTCRCQALFLYFGNIDLHLLCDRPYSKCITYINWFIPQKNPMK